MSDEYRKYNIAIYSHGLRHEWGVVGPHGGVTFWVLVPTSPQPFYDGNAGVLGGVEFHYASPPDYMSDSGPSQAKCEWTGDRPCWCDGSSLLASETWIPLFLDPRESDPRWGQWDQFAAASDSIFGALSRRYEEQFGVRPGSHEALVRHLRSQQP